MKKFIYYLKVNEQIIRDLVFDAFAENVGELIGNDYWTTNHIEFSFGENDELTVQCISAISESIETRADLLESNRPVYDVVKEYKSNNANFIYFKLDGDILRNSIIRGLTSWKIKGKPNKKFKYFAKFYGNFNDNFRCIVVASKTEITDEMFCKIDKETIAAESFEHLKFNKMPV